jgi:hypothetical protein
MFARSKLFVYALLGIALVLVMITAPRSSTSSGNQSFVNEAEELKRAEKRQPKYEPVKRPVRNLDTGPYLEYSPPQNLAVLQYSPPPVNSPDEQIRRYFSSYALHYAKEGVEGLNVDTARVRVLPHRVVVSFIASPVEDGAFDTSLLCQVIVDRESGKILEIITGPN